MRPTFDRPVVRFLVCGGSAAAINWLARIAFSLLFSFAASVLLAYVVGLVAGFVLYRGVVWKRPDVSVSVQLLRFLAVNAGGAVVVLIVSIGLTKVGLLVSGDTPLVESLAHGCAIALGAVANYLGHSRFTFAPPRAAVA